MTTRLLPTSILMLLSAIFPLAITGCKDEHAADKQAIQVVWENYDRANVEKDGNTAAGLFTKNTIAHYDKVLKLGLNAKLAECQSLPPHQWAEVVMMRNRGKRSMLGLLNGHGYIVFATQQGWYADSGGQLSLKKIKVTGDSANGVLYDKELEEAYRQSQWQRALAGRRSRYLFGSRMEKPPEYPVAFARENGQWRLDETSLYPTFDAMWKEAARWEGMSVHEYIIEDESADSGKEITKKIYEPMP